MADAITLGPITVTLVPLLATVVVLLALERGVELWIDARHRRRLTRRDARLHQRDGFRLILAAQAALFVLPVLEVWAAPWPGLGWWSWLALAALVTAQGIRYWVIRTLGDRWTLRVITVPDAPRIQRGPYRFLPHPNYVAVVMEAIALPLLVGAWGALFLVPALHALALTTRIRAEEQALASAA